MALIAAAIAVVMLAPLCYFFPEKIGTISVVGAAFILLCLFMAFLFKGFNEAH